MLLLLLLLLLLAARCSPAAAQTSLFPVQRAVYVNHSRLTSADDACTSQEQSTDNIAYILYGATYRGFFPCTNGLVSFQDAFRSYTPNAFPVSHVPIVAPFWADVDLRTCNTLDNVGCSYYAHLAGAAAGVIDEQIQNEFGYPSFEATGAIVQTWDQVGYFSRKTNFRNTFQAIIATNEVETYACFYYDAIEWVTGSLDYAPAQCGFDAGDGINEVTIPGSLTEDVRAFEGNSYCFRTSDVVICQPGEIRENGVCVPAGCAYFPSNQVSAQASLGAGEIGPSAAATACNASGVATSGGFCTLACAAGYQPTYTAAGPLLVAACESGSFRFSDDDGAVVDPYTVALCQPVGLTVTAPALLEAYESPALAGVTAPVRLSLTAPPSGTVVVSVEASDPSEVAVSPPNVTFTAENYNVPQLVAVVPVVDGVVDGDVAWTLSVAVASSSESLTPQPFAALAPQVLAGITYDEEGIVVAPRPLQSATDRHQTSESDTFGSEYFDLLLSSAPAAPTTVTCVSSDPAEGTVTTSSEGQPTGVFLFTTANWDTPARVRVQGVADDVKEGTNVYSVSCSAAAACTALDSNATVTCFDGEEVIEAFSLQNVDTNELGVVVDAATAAEYLDDAACAADQPAQLLTCPLTPAGCGTLVLEQGATPTAVSVVLASEPYTLGAQVVVSAAVTADGDQPQVAAAVTATAATFTAANWNVPQQILLSAARLAADSQPREDVPLSVVVTVDAAQTTDTGYAPSAGVDGNGAGGYSDCASGAAECFNLKYGSLAASQSLCALFVANRTVVQLVDVPVPATEDPDELPDEVIYGIIGGVLGAVIIVILVVLILACERERKVRREREQLARDKNARLDRAGDLDITFRIGDEEADLDLDHVASQLNDVQQRLLRECAKLKAENDVLAASAGAVGVGASLEDTVDPAALVAQIRQLKADNDRLRELTAAPPRPPRKKVRNKKSDFGQSAAAGGAATAAGTGTMDDEVPPTMQEGDDDDDDNNAPTPGPPREYEMTSLKHQAGNGRV